MSGRICKFLFERSHLYSNVIFTRSLGVESSSDPVADDYAIYGGEDVGSGRHKLAGISRALETYLKEVRAHEKTFARERKEFELGKRHLANIMGLDPSTITQEDIDKSIEYLFPSGLYSKRSLPVMKPPEEILPKFLKLEIDVEGRPRDPLFFTIKPKFYGFLSLIGTKSLALIRSRRKDMSKVVDEESNHLPLAETCWLPKDEFSKLVEESLTDEMYEQIIAALEHLVSLPNGFLEKDFIMKCRKYLAKDQSRKIFGPMIPEVQLIPDLQRRKAVVRTRVKSLYANTTVIDGGTGEYTVNGHSLDEFRLLLAREIYLTPLIMTDLLGKVDVSAEIEGIGGSTIIPRAVRHGVALCVAALFPEFEDKLRLAGLLTSDPRYKERKKINQPGARAKWIWKKR